MGDGSTTWMINFDYRSLNEGFMVAVGVVLAIASSFLVCGGLNMQKLSLCEAGNENISPWRQPKWVVGFVCVLFGSIIDFVAFGLAPQSLLAPLGAMSLVWNLGMASYLLNEEYTWTDVKAVILIVVGTGMTVIFASHEEHEYTLEQLRALYAEPRMLVYGIMVPLLLSVHYGLIYYVEKCKVKSKLGNVLEMIGYAGFAGITGGQSVLFAKSFVELLKDASHGDEVYLHFEFYLIFFVMVGCLLTQITMLNGGLKRFDSLYVVPVYQSYWILSSVFGGLVYFGEWETLTPTQGTMFVLGTAVTLTGLFILTQKPHKEEEKPEYQEVLDCESGEYESELSTRISTSGSVDTNDSAAFSDDVGSFSPPVTTTKMN